MTRPMSSKLLWLSVTALAGAPLMAHAADSGPAWDRIAPLLDKHCARCHQDGKTAGKFKDRPAGNFGFVLDERKMIGRNNLLVPGNADASQIYIKVQKGDMPKDIEDACYDGTATSTTYCGLTKDETAALHDAINTLVMPSDAVVADAAPAPVAPQAPAPVATAPVAPQAPVTTAAAPVAPQTPAPVATAPAAPQVPAPVTPVAPPVSTQTAAAPVAPTAQVSAAAPATAAPGLGSAPGLAAAPQAPLPVVPVSAEAPPAPPAFVTDREIIRMIAEDAGKATDTDRPNYRYFTLTHLYNAGEPEKSMRVYRMALNKLLNSLSTEADPVVPVAVDPAQTIFRVDISRLGWTPATWDGIVANDPYVIFYHNSQFRALQSDLKTVVPFVRADWFTFSASRPPLYYNILNMPKTKDELQKLIGVDDNRDFEQRKIERAGFQHSGVSDNNRLVERHSINTGAYWESYDFGSNGGQKNLFQNPFGPPGAFGDLGRKAGFVHDGGEIIFNLPNGFHAYYLADGHGNRLDTGPTKIVRDPAQRDLAVTNGISCMGCHDKGIKFGLVGQGKPLDQTRDLVLRSGSFSADAKEIVSQIYPTGDAFNRRLESDLKHYTESLAAAGVNVNTKDDGVEMINALSKRFEENISVRLAAAELGMETEPFLERLNAAGGQAYDLKLRLQQDMVPRDQFVALFAPLVNTINDEGDKAIDLTKVAAKTNTSVTAVAAETKKAPTNSKTFDLAFYANATSFKVGDFVTFTLKSEQPCFLTLLDTDDKGRSTVLFPNRFHPDGKIAAGVSITVPGPEIAGFKIRAPEPGTERITANCNASFDQTVQQDFSNAAFTTFQSTRDLVGAQVDARVAQQAEIKKRLLEVVGTQPDVARNDALKVAQEVNPVALVQNPAEPIIPITAQKSVVLQIRAR